MIDGSGRISLDYSPESLERFKIMENFENLRRQGIVELDANWNVKSVASGRQVLIDPKDIRFSQKSVGYMSSDGVNNLDTTGKTARVAPERIVPMDVVVMPDGRLTSVDNRRLAAGQLYEADKVNVVIRGSADPLLPEEVRRFSWEQYDAKTWGDAALIRVFKQGREFRETFRVGSPVMPLIKNAPVDPMYFLIRHLRNAGDKGTEMIIREVRLKLDPGELPSGFAYPVSFLEFVDIFPRVKEWYEPWGIIADVEANNMWSESFGRPLIQFAQAWHEDMLACFVVDGSSDPSVVVINPWQQRMVDGKAERYCMLREQFPNFTAWFDWMRDSELVRDRAADRAEEARDMSAERPR